MTEVHTLIGEGLFDFVQVMGIAEIGYQGEPFAEAALGRIRELRQAFPDLVMSVDGGVSSDTIVRLVEAGAQRFVSGSAIFGGGLIEENISGLEAAIGIETKEL